MVRHVLIIAVSVLLMMPIMSHAQEYLWCFEGDEILFDLNPISHVLTIQHNAAMYNCCPEPVEHVVVVQSRLITVTETVNPDAPCDCICCFNTKVQVGELDTGFWTVHFTWRNEEDGQWYTQERVIAVPEGEIEQDPQLMFSDFGECQEISAVPDPVIEPASWDLIKSRYHSS